MAVGSSSIPFNFNLPDFNKKLDNITKKFDKVKEKAAGLKENISRLGSGLGTLGKAASFVTAPFVEAAIIADKYKTTLNILLGSTQEGSRMFQEMAEFAASVPFEFEKVMNSATALSAVMKGGVAEVKQYMPHIADIAAATNMSIEDATGEIINMYTAGANSAEKFKQNGAYSMLGFKSEVEYSAEETRQILLAMFEDPNRKFKDSTVMLAQDWGSMVGMLKDQWMLFRLDVVDSGGLWGAIKKKISDVLGLLKTYREDGTLKDWAGTLSDAMFKAINKVLGFFRTAITFFAQTKDAWSALDIIKIDIEIGYKKAIYELNKFLTDISTRVTGTFIDLAKWISKWLTSIVEAFNNNDWWGKGAVEAALTPLIDGFNKAAKNLEKESKAAKDRVTEQEKELEDLKKQQAALISGSGSEDSESIKKLLALLSDLKKEANSKGAGNAAGVIDGVIKNIEDKLTGPGKKVSGKKFSGTSGEDIAEGAANKLKQLQQQISDIKFENSLIGLSAKERNKREAARSKEEMQKYIAVRPEISTAIDQLWAFRDAQVQLNQLEESKNKVKDFKKEIDDIEFDIDISGLSDLDKQLKINAREAENLKTQFADLIAMNPELGDAIDKLQGAKKRQAEHTAEMAKSQEEIGVYGEIVQGFTGTISSVLTGAISDYFTTGEFDFSKLIEKLSLELKIMAAAKTVEFLMRAAYHGIMTLIDDHGNHGMKAIAALKGAAIMGSFTLGSILGGMAHGGITDIPREGTWLLDKGERVVDADTNRDLKEYLGKGGGTNVNMHVAINGGDQAGVERALPALRKTIIDAVASDISANGTINKTIRTYAR